MTRLEVDPGRPGDAACTDTARARAASSESRRYRRDDRASTTERNLATRGASSRRRVRGRGDHRHPPREIPLDDVHDRVCGLEEVLARAHESAPAPVLRDG